MLATSSDRGIAPAHKKIASLKYIIHVNVLDKPYSTQAKEQDHAHTRHLLPFTLISGSTTPDK